ncbi:restriction endonuclease subunit S [uncultured Methanomethylovorans sp.]|uniref:restriction endonuclease subunit S n=1 Tax=uncultured Methanomethylovorans sp. TaxID=183759 RepID=UPI002AA619D5|nr:restriction endonuclease subunit S [uncultured Methanomethylovorans sp.]
MLKMNNSISLTKTGIENLPRLPEGWQWVRLGEAHILKSDKHNGSGESLFYIGLEHIEKDRGTLTQDVKIDTITTVKNSFKKGDLLYGKLRPYLNKVYLANEDGVCSTDILVFKSASISNLYYSKYFFLSRKFVSDMTHNSSGVNLPRVSTKYLQEYPFPLLPLPEQRAIVSKIEQLFSDLDNGIANLRLAQEQLKVYRQAVLKKAFEGELTRKWREQQTDLPDARGLLEQIRMEREEAAKASGKKVKPVKPLTEDEIAELPGLPEGWGWVKTAEVIDPINNGYTPKANFLFSGSGEIPFIKVYNLNFDGSFNFQKDPTFIPEAIHKKELARWLHTQKMYL